MLNDMHFSVFGCTFKVAKGCYILLKPWCHFFLLLSGETVADKPLPTLPSAFFYRLETVAPTFDTAEETFVSQNKLVYIPCLALLEEYIGYCEC